MRPLFHQINYDTLEKSGHIVVNRFDMWELQRTKETHTTSV